MPVAKVCWAAKVAVVAPAPSCSAAPTPCRRAVVGDDEVGLAVAVESATATERDWLPVAKVCWAAKEGVVAPGAVVFSSTDTVAGAVVGDDEVGPAVAVDVRHRHGTGTAAGGEGLLGGEGAVVAPAAVVFSSTDTVSEL